MGNYTIENLRLNMLAAESGNLWEILPEDHADEGNSYPLPSDYDELVRVASLGQGRRGRPQAYIRRARLKVMLMIRAGAATNIEQKSEAADELLTRSDEILTKVEREASQIVNQARARAQEATSSLTELYDLVKKGDRMVMEAFIQNKPVHPDGTKVSVKEWNDLSGKIKVHVARIGMDFVDPQDKEASEYAIFEDAVRSARDRLRASAATPSSTVKGPETDQ